MKRSILASLLLLAVARHAGPPVSRVALADSDPCAAVAGLPAPPGGHPRPTIGGRVTDATLGLGIEGVSVELHRCSGTRSVPLANTKTASDGVYAFEGLASGVYYFIAVPLSGPLTGMTPANGVAALSELLGLGESISGLDFAFE
ncbi:MAG: carboxypeptidase regulatory-like domain-containing protein [Caldilineae bacterium]|nr:carboxypeptidase regulatory-like domain-containing protein [Chloroflexota bacterium]MCB9175916.1 carboxypeptidase regulatory-like domain-containing protein [Caldilineae bacterium]